jgi:hypothetical protein
MLFGGCVLAGEAAAVVVVVVGFVSALVMYLGELRIHPFAMIANVDASMASPAHNPQVAPLPAIPFNSPRPTASLVGGQRCFVSRPSEWPTLM